MQETANIPRIDPDDILDGFNPGEWSTWSSLKSRSPDSSKTFIRGYGDWLTIRHDGQIYQTIEFTIGVIPPSARNKCPTFSADRVED
jgi:hypothetical protein